MAKPSHRPFRDSGIISDRATAFETAKTLKGNTTMQFVPVKGTSVVRNGNGTERHECWSLRRKK